MTPLRVMGVVPPTGRYVREDRCQAPVENLKAIALRPPIDLLYAGGAFEQAGSSCRLADYPAEERGWTEFTADLTAFRPDLVLLSVTTQTLPADVEAATIAHRVLPGARVLAKGAHFSTLDEDALRRYPMLDGVLRGEIEETCRDLGRGLAFEAIAGLTWRRADGTIARNPDRPFPDDLDALPFPARHLIDNRRYRRPDTGAVQTSIVTNRGCPFHCSYCLANLTAGTRNRYRSVANVMAELRECVERHGIRNVLFRSDLFTQQRTWVLELCAAIEASGLQIAWACNARVGSVDAELLRVMKRAGCWIVAFGVESGDQATLERVDKRQRVDESFAAIRACRAAGIKSCAYLMLGFPWDTPESAVALSRFARDLDPDVIEVFFPYPFPGTPLRQQVVDAGLLPADAYPVPSYAEPAFAVPAMEVSDLVAARKRILRDFYLRPQPILRTLAGARSPVEFANYVRVGWAQMRAFLQPA